MLIAHSYLIWQKLMLLCVAFYICVLPLHAVICHCALCFAVVFCTLWFAHSVTRALSRSGSNVGWRRLRSCFHSNSSQTYSGWLRSGLCGNGLQNTCRVWWCTANINSILLILFFSIQYNSSYTVLCMWTVLFGLHHKFKTEMVIAKYTFCKVSSSNF